MKTAPQDLSRLESLLEIVAALRAPGGCPWDREQTHQSLTPHALEEAAELVDAIDRGDKTHIQEELGDCLLQVVLHAQIASEVGHFNWTDVVRTLNEKLVFRHPHVFGDVQLGSAKEALENWQKMKSLEKPKAEESMGGPTQLAALTRATKIGRKTKKLKFDWSETGPILDHLHSEIRELQEALQKKDKAEIESEIGDMLFCMAQIARHEDVDAEGALRRTNLRFEKRFQTMMALVLEKKLDWAALSDAQKEALWQEAKTKLKLTPP